MELRVERLGPFLVDELLVLRQVLEDPRPPIRFGDASILRIALHE